MGRLARLLFVWLSIGALIGTRVNFATAAAPTAEGCFQDDPLTSAFVATPGGFNPSLGITVEQCSSACFALKYPFAGVQEGLYCFCALDGYQLGLMSGTGCNSTCLDTYPCGGKLGWTTVYTSAPAKPTVQGLSIAVVDSTPPLTLTDETMVNLVVNVTTNRTLLDFVINAGDGSEPASFPGDNATSFPITFSKPGTFVVSVTASFKNGIGYGSSAKTTVTVVDPPTFNYTCPLAVDASAPFNCTLNQATGYTSTKINALWDRVAPGLPDNYTYLVPDPTYLGVGAMFPSLASPPAAELGGSESGTFKIRSAYFTEAGLVTDVEAYVYSNATGATVTFSIATVPTCPATAPTFCPQDNKCHAAACTMSMCAANNFCAYGGTCCPADTGVFPTDYGTTAVLASATITILDVPHRITAQPVNGFVPAGGILMVDCPSPCQIFFRLAKTGEPGDVDASAVDTGKVHLARANVVNKTEVLLAGTCRANSENITTAFSISNLAGVPAPPAGQVISCQTPIVNLSVTVDDLVAVNEDINMTISMDKGAPVDLMIQWDETNASTIVAGPYTPNYTMPITVSHSYGTDGVFVIKVNATNMLSGLQGHDFDNVTTQVAVYYPVTVDWTLTPIGLTQNILVAPPGSVQFQLTYNGTTRLPTNATATLYTGDGGVLIMPVNASAIVFDLHTFSTSGEFFIYANISNAYNSMVFPLNIAGVPSNLTVWQAISNVTAQFRYRTDTSGPDGLPGTGATQMDFPMEWNTTVFPQVGAGVVENYTIFWADNMTVGAFCPVTNIMSPNNDSVDLYLPQEGVYNITLSACNQIQGCVPSNITYPVRILGRVVNVTIDDYRMIVPPNNNKSLQLLFESMGGSTCVIINWGDGSIDIYGTNTTCQSIWDMSPDFAQYYHPTPPLTNPMPLTHIYVREGMYDMSVTAWNALSSASATLSIVAADIPCLTPSVWITRPANGMVFKRPEPVIISGVKGMSITLILLITFLSLIEGFPLLMTCSPFSWLTPVVTGLIQR